MFIVGKEYRVWPLNDGMSRREGVLVEAEGPIFVIDVDGVQTIFHMATVACVELIDHEAEEARRKADSAKRADAWG